ncbi:MAG TPA: hypothetical protein VFF65_08100 [Phycisphaerales bacterium]|nr:hypothetical protein [Phycisphaerales bacterium]
MLRLPALRRWRMAGAVIVLVGLLVPRVPAVVQRGWIGAVPDLVLVYAAPADRAPTSMQQIPQSPMILPWPATAPAPPASEPLSTRLHKEVWERLEQHELSRWCSGIYVQRVCGEAGSNLESLAALPSRWPWDHPLPPKAVQVNGLTLAIDADDPAGPTGSVTLTMSLQVGSSAYPVCSAALPIDMRSGVRDFMRRVSGPDIDRLVQRALRPRLVYGADRPWVTFDDRRSDSLWAGAPGTIDCRVQILVDGEHVGSGTVAVHPDNSMAAITLITQADWSQDVAASVMKRPEAVEIRVEGDPAASVRRFLNGQTMLPADAWAGSFRMRLAVEPR